MRRLGLLGILILVLAGCLQGENISHNAMSNVLYVHDDTHHVGCWYFSGGGVSCLSDGDYHH